MNEKTKKYVDELGIKNLKPIKEKIKEIKKDEWKELSFTINGEPLQTSRPRTTKFGKFYVPNASKNKKFIRNQIKEQVNLDNFKIIQGEVEITMKFFVSIPKGFSNTDKILAELGYIKPIITPDIDNFMKTYMDALTDVLWLDDGQVIKGIDYKFYSFEPRVEIKLKYKNDIHCFILKNYAKNKKKNFDLKN